MECYEECLTGFSFGLNYKWNHFLRVSNKCAHKNFTLHAYEFNSCDCKLIENLFLETLMLFFCISYYYRVIICWPLFSSNFPDFSFDWIKTKPKQNNKNNRTHHQEKKLTYETVATKGKLHRQSSSLNGLNLITALFCIIFVSEKVCVCICVCTQQWA